MSRVGTHGRHVGYLEFYYEPRDGGLVRWEIQENPQSTWQRFRRNPSRMFEWRLSLLQQHGSWCDFLQGLEVIVALSSVLLLLLLLILPYLMIK